MSLKAAQVELALERIDRDRDIKALSASGVRDGSLERILRLSDKELAGGYQPGASAYLQASLKNVYKPDPKNDRAAILKRELASREGVRLTVWCDTPLGTRESIAFEPSEAKVYLESDAGARAKTRGRLLLERHLGVALTAAQRLRAKRLTESVRSEQLLENLSNHELVCLKAFGGLQNTVLREARGETPAITVESLRPQTETRLRKALKESKRITSVERLREVLGLTDTVPMPQNVLPGVPRSSLGPSYPYENYLQFGPNQRQMLLNDVWDEQAKCAYRFARDPICKQAIRIKTNYVLGRGVSVVATSKDPAKKKIVQDVLDEFNDRKKMDRTWPRWANNMSIRGEIFLREIELSGTDADGESLTGRTDFRKLPAPSIWEIHTDAEDVDEVIEYVQRYRTRSQLFAPQLTEYIDRVIPAEEVIHYKLNADDDEVRGRGDPYGALAWHERFTNFWDAEAEKDYATSAFQFYAKLNGTSGDVKRFLETSVPKGRPSPGGWLVFNDKVDDVGVVKGDTSAPAGRGSSNDGLLNIIAANYQISKTYLGVEGYQSRAGAAIQVGPAEKGFEERQDDIGALMGLVYDRVITNAQAGGLIPEDYTEEDLAYQINFPAIIKADSDVRIKNIVVGRTQGFVSHQTGAEMWATEMDAADTYNYEDEQERIKAEAAEGITLPQPLKTDSGPGADWQQAGGPAPSGGKNGKQPSPNDPAIAKQDGQRANETMTLEAALAVAQEHGAIVIL